MASDVEDLTTFYANLPSIFENGSSSSIEPSYNAVVTDVNTEKFYQPIFGSFLFADSDPLSRAAFVPSSSQSIEVRTTQERLMDDCTLNSENNISSTIQTTPSSPPPLAPTEDIDDDDNEDDFDGIPIRHAPITMKKKLNGDSDSIDNHSKDDHLFNEFIRHIENSHDDNDLEDDSFLNGFTDEQHDTTTIVPSLFKDIPDIDDPNQQEEDDNDRIHFDHMDMFDQSDSIRSSSPDSLLSSSHLQDDQDGDDADIDDEVAQWNDDIILNTTSSNINSQTIQKTPPLILHVYPFDQVDFMDSSRSNSRCSNVSSHLSIGYADQARIFMSDDGLMTSSDSDDNDNNDDIMNLDCDTSDRDNNEELCLQVNLDDRRSLSSFSKSNSTHSSSPIPDETPIIDIDEDNDESKTVQIAPIAALDDEDDDDNDLQTFMSDQPVLPILTSHIKNLIELTNEKRQNEIIHDIINMRHLFNENDHDDEFIAIMHNPSVFEQVLYDHDNNNNNNNDQKKSDSVKQTNSVSSTFRPTSQLSIDNKIKKESFEHNENIHQISSLLESNNEKTSNSSSSTFYTRKTTTTNNSSPTAVNYLTKKDEERKENDVSVNVVNTTDILNTKEIQEQLHRLQTNSSNININQFTNGNKSYSIMNTDNESDDDSELLKTLSQLHDIINTTQFSEEDKQGEAQLSSFSPIINEEKNFPDFSSENLITNGNETELSNKKSQHRSHIIPSSPYVIDAIKIFDEEQKEKDEKKNVIFHKNHNVDDDDDDKQKEKYERRKEGKKPPTFFSLTSTTSPTLFNDDSHSTVVIIDPDTSLSLPNLLLSSNQLNDSTLFSNQLITDDLQISSTKSNMNNLPNDDLFQQTTTTNLFDPFAPTTTSTAIGLSDDSFIDSKDADVKEFNMQQNFSSLNSTSTQLLGNYDFDDLWNQSISHIVSSNDHEIKSNNDIDPNTFTWDAFLNNNNNNDEKTNPFNDNTTIPTTNLTWESLFGEEQEDENDLKNFLHWIISHLNESEQIETQPIITFTSIQNLESIIKDIQMCGMPFEPIPSPPLHVDHTVTNPMINAIHHELFPIDELEQSNNTQGQQSMILYEEEEEEEEENNESSFDNEVKPIVEKLVSDILQLALTEINESYQQIEHFVDQILSQAIFEVYNEDINLSESEINDIIPTENLASIISWHDQTKATNKQLLDPFDKKFDTVWSSHFEAPDDTTNENLFENENKNDTDPWLITTTTTTTMNSNTNIDPMVFFSKTLDESDLFSTTSNPTSKIYEIEDDEAGTFSEYVPPPLLKNPSNTTMAANNLMKYTLTASLIDDSGDDSSILEDYLSSRKNEASVATNVKVDEEPTETQDMTSREQQEDEINEQNNFFSNKARLSQFEVFASDQPLHSPEIESKFANIIAQLNNESSQLQQSTDNNAPWISLEKPIETVKSSGIGGDEPWELEDNGEEKITPIPTTIRLSTAFNDNEFSTTEKLDSHNNFFSDSFNPLITIKQSSSDQKENYDDYFIKHQSNENIEHSLTKTVRFDDNVQNIHVPTPPKDHFDESESSTTNDSDEVEVDDILPSFETINDRITNHMETSYVNIDETDIKTEHPYESVELTPHTVTTRSENEDLPPPLPSLPPLNNKSSK